MWPQSACRSRCRRRKICALMVSALTVSATGVPALATASAPSKRESGPGVMQRFGVKSAALHATVGFRLLVTAPPHPGGHLDLLLLIHGANAHDEQWDDVGIDDAVKTRSADGTMRPTLVVLPDGDSAMTAPGTDAAFATFLLHELLPALARRYPVSTARSHRSIGGISRGGMWAFTIASDHPDLFSRVGGHSAVVPTGAAAAAMARVFARHRLRVWVDVGKSDALEPNDRAFAEAIRRAGASVTFEQHAGIHDRAYWRSQSSAYAAFYAGAPA